MRKRTKNLIGAMFLIMSILATQIPMQDVTAASTSSSDFIYQDTTLVQYTGTDNSVSVPASVTKIGENAFSGCTSLESVSIPDSVEEIGSAAFSNCTALDSVTIQGTSLRTFGNGVFAGCQSLSDITFDSSASFLCEDGAIYNQSKTTLYELLEGSNTTNFSIPSTVTDIASFACWGCSSLKSITIPDSLTVISAYAFADCTGLTSITIPSTVERIAMKAFADCVNLETTSIAPTTVVDETAFDGCTKLASSDIQTSEYEDTTDNAVILDGSVSENDSTTETDTQETAASEEDSGYSFVISASGESLATTKIVGEKAVLFIDNTKQTVLTGDYIAPSIETGMTADTTDNTNATASDSAAVSGNDSAALMQNISNTITSSDEKGVTIPKYISYNGKIAQQAFYQDEELTTYEFPDNITAISDFAFARSALTEIDIPEGVTNIGYAAFYHCDDLLTVSIPDSVTEIEAYAFDHTAWIEDWKNNGSSDYLIVGDGILLAYRGSSSKISIPDNVKHVAAYVFSDHKGITSVICPESLQTIEESAFEGCTNLSSVSFDAQLTKVADRAFSGCPITNLEVPPSVTEIGLGAFDETGTTLTGNDTITFEGDILPTVSYEKSSERLTNSDDRVLALNGISYALVSNSAAESMEDTILDASEPGFHGIIFTPVSDDAGSVTPILEITDGTEQIQLPDTITSKGITYQVKNDFYETEESSFDKDQTETEVTSDIDNTMEDASEYITVYNMSSQLSTENEITATIEGNTDYYMLRISDSDSAEKALNAGYESAYGTELPDSCISLEMGLYDSSGTIPITKLGKQVIEITFALPESLLQGGSLHVITTDSDGQIEELSYTKQIEDNGTYVTFQTSHFSPFGLYEYVGETTSQTAALDDTPDTGDLIAPKWFLALGCFFLAMIFFLMPSRSKKRLNKINFN